MADGPARPDGPGARPVGRIRRRVSQVPRTLWLITALWVSLLLGASVLWPMSYGYDEPQHVDMAYVYSAHPFTFYGPGRLHLTRSSIGLQGLLPGYPPHVPLGVAPIDPRGRRPSLAALGGSTPSPAAGPNQMVQHPPLYYWLEAAVLRVPGVSNLAWDLQIWVMRLLSVVLLLPLPALCWATARRLLVLDGERAPEQASRLALLAAAVPLTVPNLIRDGSSVNNDTLLILTTSVVLYLLSRVIAGDRSLRTATWIALSLAGALLTKGFALVLPPIVLAAYVLGWWRSGAEAALRRAWSTPLAVAAVGGVVGGLWWLRNLIDYGAVQVSGFGPGYDRILFGTPDNRGSLTGFVPAYVTAFVSRIWGGIGLPDWPDPGPLIVYGWFFVVLIGVLATVCVRANRGSRRRAAVLASVVPLSIVVAASGSLPIYRRWSNLVPAAQGRYLYQAMVVIAALAAVGWFRLLLPRMHARLLPGVLVAGIVTNAVAWLLLVRTWYQPATESSQLHMLRQGVHGVLRWSPLPDVLTILFIGLLPIVASIAAVGSATLVSRELVAADLSG